jgi:hypothetical protein
MAEKQVFYSSIICPTGIMQAEIAASLGKPPVCKSLKTTDIFLSLG